MKESRLTALCDVLLGEGDAGAVNDLLLTRPRSRLLFLSFLLCL
jgi:hypothetical protein